MSSTKALSTRDGEDIDGIYSGVGHCFVDANGKRYGLAEWMPGRMDGTGPAGTVRPIVQEYADAIRAQRRPYAHSETQS